jgi:hypothetical protein
MRVRDINYLPAEDKIVIPFDGLQPAATDADGLLAGLLGRVAANHRFLPISFDCWPDVPLVFKNHVWSHIMKV